MLDGTLGLASLRRQHLHLALVIKNGDTRINHILKNKNNPPHPQMKIKSKSSLLGFAECGGHDLRTLRAAKAAK